MGQLSGAGERFERLYRANVRPLLGYLLRRVDRSEDAVDVLADTMLVAWRRIDEVPPGDEACLWLFGVARRVLANHRRGRRRQTRLADRLRSDVIRLVGDEPLRAVETTAVVATALAGLDEDDRELLGLTAWEGFEPHEIAVVLGIPPTTVRTRLHRARGRLRAQLDLVGWPGDNGERSAASGHVDHDGHPLVRNAEGET